MLKLLTALICRRIFIRTLLLTAGAFLLPLRGLFAAVSALPTAILGSMTEAQLSNLVYLTRKEFELLNAIADRILPADTRRGLPSASRLKTIERLDKIIPLKLDAASQADFKKLLGLFDSLSWGLFLKYSDTQKDRYLGEWEQSAIPLSREGFRALKKLIATAYFSQEAVWPVIGYRGPYQTVPWSQKDPADTAISPLLPPIETGSDQPDEGFVE